jgi:tetratricopeptide (TPR) repeat protein
VLGPKLLDQGKALLADWHASRASQKSDVGDFSGAIEDLNEAIGWNPRSQAYFAQRAICREELNDLEGSVADWNKSIELLQGKQVRRGERISRRMELVEAYRRRGWVNVRLKRTDAALEDMDTAIQSIPNQAFFRDPRVYDELVASLWNARAYTCAVLNVKLKEGLADIDRALEQVNGDPSFLDTRGYLLHLLGRNEEALKDMNSAIDTYEEIKRRSLQWKVPRASEHRFQRELQRIDESLAVMYQHRGLILERLGRQQEADKDFADAKTFGYDPKLGVF